MTWWDEMKKIGYQPEWIVRSNSDRNTVHFIKDSALTIDEKIEQLEKELEKLKAKKEKTWPQHGDEYVMLDSEGDWLCEYWYGLSVEENRARIGNIFRNREEANRMVLRLKARKKFLDAGGHEGLECSHDSRPKYVPSLDIDGGIFVEPRYCVSAFEIWFKSYADCQKAIDSLTEEEVKALCYSRTIETIDE